MTDMIVSAPSESNIAPHCTDATRGGQLLTPAEAAAILRVTPRTLVRYAEDGRLHRVRLSSRASRYTRESVAALITGAPRP
jgi:hypothetical protein